MSYFQFLLQWYNWPYLVGLGVTVASLAHRPLLSGLGASAGRRLGLTNTPGHSVVRTFGLTFIAIGLTLNGVLHDYWSSAQQRGFLPVLVFALLVGTFTTRRLGRFRERHFPPIKAIGLGSNALQGLQGQVVSSSVGPNYRAGRAQVMGSDETLHMAMCKTTGEEIPYGTKILLGEYDSEDGRYLVERLVADPAKVPTEPASSE